MLIIWTASDAESIRRFLGPALVQYPTAHRIEPSTVEFPKCAAGDVVLACGTAPFLFLQKLGIAPKNRSLGSMLNAELSYGGIPVLLSYDPSLCYMDWARTSDIIWAVRKAVRLHVTSTTAPALGNYYFVDSLHGVIESVVKKYEETGVPVPIACDIETKGLDPYNPDAWIISISFTVDVGVSEVVYFHKGERPTKPGEGVSGPFAEYWAGLWKQINWLLNTPAVSIRGANFKYDSNWMVLKWGIHCTNFRFDTLLVGSLLDENRTNTLKLHAKLFTDLGGYEDSLDGHDMGFMETVPLERFITYAGGDTDATLQVAGKFKSSLLQDRALSNFYVKLLHPASLVFEKMERTGILVDVDYYHQLKKEVSAEIDSIQDRIISSFPLALRAKHHESFLQAMAQGKSPLKPAVVKEFMFSKAGLNLKPLMVTEKTKEPSTSLDHLKLFSDVPEAAAFVEDMGSLSSATKTLSTYIVGFLKHLKPDGRFHPSYMLHRGSYGAADDDSGTVTGRCLTAEARILTDKGEIPIRELVERGEQGEEFKVLTHKNRWLPVTGFWRNGVKPVCTVRAQGRSLTSTYNHPYMSFPSWVLAEDLKTGSVLYAVVEPPKVEEWRPIKGWPFEVSNMGRVRRGSDGHGVKAGDIYKQQAKGKWGHLKVTLRTFGEGAKKQDFPVHRLVADAFLTNNGGVEIAHLNGDAACNWSTNLKWASIEENKLHFRLHGTANREGQKKLDWEKVDAIRAGLLGDDHQAAAYLGVSRELVRDVRLWKKWNGRRDSMAGFAPIRVDSVSDAGMQETFDLTVDEDHSFVANGLVVHNTSAKEPAVQCLPRWVKVLTKDGYRGIIDIVEGYERGEQYEVVTHDGSWRDVVGVYRNGVQPLFRVTLESGHSITCTGNHPLLTSAGFVRADNLVLGDECYVIGSREKVRKAGGIGVSDEDRCPESQVSVPVRLWGGNGCSGVQSLHRGDEILRVLEGGVQQDARAHDAHDAKQNLHLLEEHPEEVLLGESQFVQELRGLGHQGLQEVAHLQELSGGHGRDAYRAFDRTQGQQEGLRAGKQYLDSEEQAEPQQTEYGTADLQREDAGVGGLVGRNGTPPVGLDLEKQSRVESGSGAHDAQKAKDAGYLISAITCIERVEPEDTFDLTIEGSHSFVANGVVVHNTTPKHTKWSKKLRRAFIAPPGKSILQCDYSQGELRICAVVAQEPTMIKAYRSGADLHAITAAALNKYSMEYFLSLPEDIRDELRSGGKAGNFGLIYGMQPPGYREYAFSTYGVSLTEEQAVDQHESFFALYNRLPEWHSESKGYARLHKMVRSPLGRVRHLPHIDSRNKSVSSQAERQAINSPIQSCLSDMMQLAMVYIDLKYGDQVQIFLMTHDSLALYVPEGDEVLWAKVITAEMENLPLLQDFGWDSPLTFYADAEFGNNMAALAKIKNLK